MTTTPDTSQPSDTVTAAGQTPLVSAQGLRKEFHGNPVLDDIDFDVASGEIPSSSARAARANPPCCG